VALHVGSRQLVTSGLYSHHRKSPESCNKAALLCTEGSLGKGRKTMSAPRLNQELQMEGLDNYLWDGDKDHIKKC